MGLEQLLLPEAEAATSTNIDRRLYDTIFAEVGGGPEAEVNAVTSVFLNRAKKEGYEKALRGSSAYRKQSKEYQKAKKGNLTPFEKKVYERNKKLIDYLSSNPDAVEPYTFFENVKAFGDPIERGLWPKEMKNWNKKDIGRQRFYWK